VAEFRAAVPAVPNPGAEVHPEAAGDTPAAGTGRAAVRIRAVAAVGRCADCPWPHEHDMDPLPMARAGGPREVTRRAESSPGS